ncbi:hypothetical protein ACO0RG_000623 [Hanseniaspora osmophila]|uniref:Uncharacterized protein n=1 Tax=Hanseniaspora osmophila TaxID=56408 RepID=A0A1E5R237_9ASCO|nr:hypothetical protein AWRI3579_g4147 [Hanseniaspora osmophila]
MSGQRPYKNNNTNQDKTNPFLKNEKREYSEKKDSNSKVYSNSGNGPQIQGSLMNADNDGLPTYDESMQAAGQATQSDYGAQYIQTRLEATRPPTNNMNAPYVHFPHPKSNTNFPGGKTTTYNNVGRR